MKKAKKTKQYIDQNPIEQILSIGTGVAQSVADSGKKAVSLDNWEEILGFAASKEKQKKHSEAGDLTEGQVLELRKIHKQDQEEAAKAEKTKAHAEPGIDYAKQIVHAGERLASRETQEIDAQLQEIMIEIKKLADSSKELQAQFREVAVEQHVVKPGKYHKNFFEWMLLVIRQARMKVEDSGAWLAAMQSKKKSKSYWSLYKKVGANNFGLSGERVVATQVG